MIHCSAIVSDSELLRKILEFSKEVYFIQMEECFSQYESSKKLLNSNTIDLIFLETRIDNYSAFEFYMNYKNSINVIFIGKDKSEAFDAFFSDAIDFLDFNINFSRFIQAINKAKRTIDYQRSLSRFEDNFLHIRSEYKLVKIAHSEITYFETLDDYIKVHLLGKKPILTLMSMKNLLNKLPAEKFIRVHRSYIVSIQKVISVRGKTIDLGISEVPIGKSYESDFYKMYMKEGF